MKKYILSPLSSLFVLGLGQIINEQIKKGLSFLGLVFIILVAIGIKLVVVINRRTASTEQADINLTVIAGKMTEADLSLIWGLLFCLVALWIYSIIDAFWIGLKIEKGKARQKDEIYSDR